MKKAENRCPRMVYILPIVRAPGTWTERPLAVTMEKRNRMALKARISCGGSAHHPHMQLPGTSSCWFGLSVPDVLPVPTRVSGGFWKAAAPAPNAKLVGRII